MGLSSIGCIVWKIWKEILVQFNNILTDECIVMPNHLRGIVRIADTGNNKSDLKNVDTLNQGSSEDSGDVVGDKNIMKSENIWEGLFSGLRDVVLMKYTGVTIGNLAGNQDTTIGFLGIDKNCYRFAFTSGTIPYIGKRMIIITQMPYEINRGTSFITSRVLWEFYITIFRNYWTHSFAFNCVFLRYRFTDFHRKTKSILQHENHHWRKFR